MKGFDHLPELVHLSTRVAGGAIAGHGGEIAQRVVTPIVCESFLDQRSLVDKVVYGKKFHSRNAELLEVIDAHFVAKPGIGPAQLFRDFRIANTEAPNMNFVNNGVGQGEIEPAIAFPVKFAFGHDALWNAGRRILSVYREIVPGSRIMTEDRRLPVDLARDRLGVRIDQEFSGIEATTLFRFPRAIDAISIELAWLNGAEQAVPHMGCSLAKRQAAGLSSIRVKQAKINLGGAF